MKLKSKIENKQKIKSKPSIDYEADSTQITSRYADTIIAIAIIINKIALKDDFVIENKEQIVKKIKSYKMSKSIKWIIGDDGWVLVFSEKEDSKIIFLFYIEKPIGKYQNCLTMIARTLMKCLKKSQ